MKVSTSDVEGHSYRLDQEQEISELANSISKHGVLSPILIRKKPKDNRFQIVFGNRRLSAAKKLKMPFIDARLVEATDQESLLLFLIENLDRKELSDYEKGVALTKLKEITGRTFSEIAEEIGKSVAYVSYHVAMLDLFPTRIASEEERTNLLLRLSERHARALSRIKDPLERWNTAKMAVGAGLGVRELERLCYRFNNKAGVSRDLKSRSVAEVIRDIVVGLNSRDARPLFDSISDGNFTLFSRFPPFDKMNTEEARNHVCDILSKLDKFHYKISDMDVKVSGSFAYVVLQVVHDLGLDGRDIRTKTRATVILQKMDDGWKIVHEHWSSANPSEPAWEFSENRKRRTSLEIQISR